jgi:hypothetical protein
MHGLLKKSEKVRVHNVESAVSFAFLNDARYVDLAGTCSLN